MRARPGVATAAPVFAAAALMYTANCVLGSAVAAKLIDTSRFRWLHHALYIATCTAAAAALSAAWWGEPRRVSRSAALALAPAAVPLTAVAFAGTRGRRHPIVALSAAPFVIAGLIRAYRPDDRS
ncbi:MULTISPECIES: hypothetical protein [unclassified Microbacterium]|uniref:hypothetical protein n=1 Tax=unclassified Microbacterium TaxID=2609290 RepID=UPI001E0D6002|nr:MULTISPECIES: hypothetical protein [unclassified Microbacterium]CAH0123136.1 hypothetical protein SRABI121_00315 [Microbacterium sp. Bi121]HWK79026.1 hypothetical protein [Microbacterium sp.]